MRVARSAKASLALTAKLNGGELPRHRPVSPLYDRQTLGRFAGKPSQLGNMGLEAGVKIWHPVFMGEMKKITVEVPTDTLEIAIRPGDSLADTVREALRDLAHKRACARILAMRGKLDLGLDLEELRKDKDEE